MLAQVNRGDFLPVQVNSQPSLVDKALMFAFNTPLEMLGVLVFGFCGFLSFCVGVCGFLVGACRLWLFWFGFCVGAPRREVWVSACFFSSASACAEKLHDVL